MDTHDSQRLLKYFATLSKNVFNKAWSSKMTY